MNKGVSILAEAWRLICASGMVQSWSSQPRLAKILRPTVSVAAEAVWSWRKLWDLSLSNIWI